MQNNKPNILFFMVDQLTPFVTEPYRKGMAKTPTMQQVADEGITFANAYCNNPLCTPSRMSMMTGKYCSKINSFDNGSLLPADELCFTHLLRKAGYHTVLSGKMHFVGPDQEHGFSERLTTDIYPSGLNWTSNWEVAPGGDNLDDIFKAGVVKDNKYLSYDRNSTFQATQWLRNYERLDKKNVDPFFMCVSLINPHHPYQVPQELWDLYDGEEIPLPEVRVEDIDPDDNSHDRSLREVLGVKNTNISNEDIIKARRAYFACTTFTDQRLAEILKTLEDLELSDNTWIVITSDHGDMIGERGLWYKKIFYDYSTKVPLIIKPPKGCGGKVEDLPVSLIDLFPTLTDIALVDDEFEVGGKSLIPLIEGRESSERSVISEYMGSSVLSPMRMIIKDNLKYVNIYTPEKNEELLFDLKLDPSELKNEIENPKYSNILNDLRKAVSEDGWDGKALHEHILKDQKKRMLIRNALMSKKVTKWGYVPEEVDPYDGDMFRV